MRPSESVMFTLRTFTVSFTLAALPVMMSDPGVLAVVVLAAVSVDEATGVVALAVVVLSAQAGTLPATIMSEHKSAAAPNMNFDNGGCMMLSNMSAEPIENGLEERTDGLDHVERSRCDC